MQATLPATTPIARAIRAVIAGTTAAALATSSLAQSAPQPDASVPSAAAGPRKPVPSPIGYKAPVLPSDEDDGMSLWLIGGIGAGAAAVIAFAAGGSGGGSGKGGASFHSQANVPNTKTLNGLDGRGVVIGVIDSGGQVSHPSFGGRVVATYNAFDGSADVTDETSHGTSAASVAAGAGKNPGVAPGASLALAKVFDSPEGSAAVIIEKGINWAVNAVHAPFVSLSMGATGPSLRGAVGNAVNRGTLVVSAMGNDNKGQGRWPAKFASEGWAKGRIIAVGALNAEGTKASFSNWDPALANWTVFAPGVNLPSATSNPGHESAYGTFSGTSAATPVVAGQAALIMSNWGFLPPEKVAQIIFQTADRLCSDGATGAACTARGPDAMYGWGKVNVGNSIKPVGTLSITSAEGKSSSYNDSTLRATNPGVTAALMSVDTVVTDEFNRGFSAGLPIAGAAGSTSLPATPLTVAKQGSMKFAYSMAMRDDASKSSASMRAALEFESANGARVGTGTGGAADMFFGLDSTGKSPLNLADNSSRFNAPYFGLAENATHAGMALALSPTTTLRMGTLSQGTFRGAEAALAGQTQFNGVADTRKKSLLAVELQNESGSGPSAFTSVVTVGQLNEGNSVLGMSGSGAMALEGKSLTHFATVAANKSIDESSSVSAMLSLGTTGAYSNTSSALVEGLSRTLTSAWSVGFTRKDTFKEGDNLGLTVSMPLRTMSGRMTLNTATSQNQQDGSLNYERKTLGMAPSGHERRIELSYATSLTNTAKLGVQANVRLEPGHIAAAKPDYGVGMTFDMPF